MNLARTEMPKTTTFRDCPSRLSPAMSMGLVIAIETRVATATAPFFAGRSPHREVAEPRSPTYPI